MNCATLYYLAELTLYAKLVEVFSLVPPPPPPPPPPENIGIGEYMEMVAKWKRVEVQPLIVEGCL